MPGVAATSSCSSAEWSPAFVLTCTLIVTGELSGRSTRLTVENAPSLPRHVTVCRCTPAGPLVRVIVTGYVLATVACCPPSSGRQSLYRPVPASGVASRSDSAVHTGACTV